MLYSFEKNLLFIKQVLLPNILLNSQLFIRKYNVMVILWQKLKFLLGDFRFIQFIVYTAYC